MKEEYDFSKGTRGAIDPISAHQAQVIIWLDNDIIEWFRAQVEAAGGGNYQSLMNQALREHIWSLQDSFEEATLKNHKGAVDLEIDLNKLRDRP
jgi:hypothetical protein